MHVFKEPTGIYYKLTGNYDAEILEEAKEKTYRFVHKNFIEILKTSIDFETYNEIWKELKQKF